MIYDTVARAGGEATASQRFITKVYGWMSVALLTTAFVSYYTVSNPQILRTVVQNTTIMMVLILAELGLVIALSAAINRLSPAMATALFFLYSALTGITLSVIFVIYTTESLASTFLVTAGTFGGMSIYGYATKRDLTSVGNLCFMGLFGIIIASFVNFFFSSSFLYTATTYIGVIVFVGLTAYDTQRIKRMGAFIVEGSEAERKGAIIGALQLYLDFINLFLMLLRLFGRRR